MSRVNLADLLLYRHIRDGRRDCTAIASDTAVWSYGELAGRVDRCAASLATAGIAAGDRVLLRLHSGADFIAAWLAVQKLGGVVVATSPELRERELVRVLADAMPRACFVAADRFDDVAPLLAARSTDIVCFVLDEVADAPRLVAGGARDVSDRSGVPVLRDEDDPVVLAYATDAISAPKGFGHTTRQLMTSCDLYARGILGATPDDVFGGAAPLWFAYGLGTLLVYPLALGATAAPARAFTAEGLSRLIRDRRVSLLFGTATAYRLLLKLPTFESAFDLRSLRLAVSAGEHLDVSTSAEWRVRAGCELLNGLGTTELFVIFLTGRRGEPVPGSLGAPVPGFEVRLLEDGHGPGRDARGALQVRGPTCGVPWVAGSWERRPQGAWSRTGDRLRRDPGGRYWFLGREDELIVSAGYKISPAEVAAVVESHPWVSRASITGVPDEVRGSVVKADVSWAPEAPKGEPAFAALREHVQARLAAYKWPRHWGSDEC